MTTNEEVHPTRRQVITGAAAVGVAATVGGSALAACSTTKTGGSGGSATDTRHQTLFIAGEQWSTPTNFNPLNPTATWPTQPDQMNLVYESLFGYDVRTGEIKGNLADSIDAPDAKTLVVKLKSGTKWQDGQALTADDVVYTYELAKKHSEAPWAWFWNNVSSITATDPQTITIALDPKNANPGITKASLSQVPILPKHLWTGYETQNAKLVEFTNMTPVGSGPYKVDSANATQVKYVRDDNYWGKTVRGKLPAPKWIVHPIFKDNAAGDLAFERGEVDVSQQFTPQIWKMWQDKKLPVHTWFDKPPYHLPGSIPMLVINTTKAGLSNPQVRRGIAYAIDYARIASTAMSQYSDPAQSSVIIPKGAEQQYFDADNVAKNGWTFDVNKAKQLLAGANLGAITVQTPSGWSDWEAAMAIVVENLKAAGVNASAQSPQAPQVTTAVQNGNFDLAIWYVSGASPGTPWQRFRDVLDSRGVPPKGSSAFYNYGRFTNPQVASLLDQAASATGAQAKTLFTQLDTIFMQNAPMIPLMYRPLDFFEANETAWQGFPKSDTNTASPMFRGAGIDWLYTISPKTK
ncbi:MAG TPA: ABC transporter substrate-binding protein [Rugosimonospora sp.]|nr:ABC transporter substrate-binding protein [Rugosimonospora sp.]